MNREDLIKWVQELDHIAISNLLSASRIRDLYIDGHNIQELIRCHWKKD